MSDSNNLQRVLVACFAGGITLGCALMAPSGAPAASAGHIAALRDAQGRLIYVNAESRSVSGTAVFPAPPQSVLSLIQQASERFHLDPSLLHAVVRVESDYNARAVSPKGALGLMQLIPATARRFGVADAFDPQQNIQGGAGYLRYLLDRFSGDVPRSLAAYNAGEHTVLRSIERGEGIPRILETENYVRKVTAAYRGAGVAAEDSGFRIQDSGSRDGRRGPAANSEPRIYRYVDAQGVTHFEQ